jgi:histidine triad (HIT) family protein
MTSHAPVGYVCPFCLLVAGVENERVLSRQSDLVYKDAVVTAFIGAKQWPFTPGHVLIIPNTHFENLYAVPDEVGLSIFALSRRIALAMKETYGCSGISVRQHNEPAGNQDVWHYHLHVFPRNQRDDLYPYAGSLMPPEERAVYAARLRTYFER